MPVTPAVRRAALRAAALGLGRALGWALLLIGVGAVRPGLVVAGAVVGTVAGSQLHLEVVGLRRQLRGTSRGVLQVGALLDALLVVAFLLRSSAVSGRVEAGVVLAVVTVQAAAAAALALRLAAQRLRLRRAVVRGLAGGPPPLPARSAATGEPGVLVVTQAAALPALGLLPAAAGGGYGLVPYAAGLAVAVAAAVVARSALGVARLARLPRGDEAVRLAHDAALRHRPELLLYCSSGPEDLHCVHAWLDTLEELGRPALVVLREVATLERMRPTAVPAVALPQTRDLLAFALPTARVALYVLNTPANVDLVRSAALRSAFIGHGDSDKAASANPVVTLYDEVWVAGEAGRRRYLDAGVGLAPDAVRTVGRPQVRRVRPAAPRPAGAPFRVLYAPTWEGLYGDPHESSLRHSGLQVVETLLGIEGVEVVYRPHPKSGSRDRAHLAAHDAVVARLARAGAPHRWDRAGSSDLYDTFNEVDALVSDLSAVVTDFLASGKPYAVVDGRGLPEDDFRRAHPSAAAAYVVGPASRGLAEAVALARGADPLREQRRALRVDLLGPEDVDPLDSFRAAADALAAGRRAVTTA